MADRAIAELGGIRHLRVDGQKPEPGEPALKDGKASVTLPSYKKGDKVATRKAYGDALKAIGVRQNIVAMDGEVSNSTYAEEFAKAYADRYFEMYIAEQQLIATAVGMSVRHYIPFASTFAAFFSRAYDFIRMAAISRANIRLAGSHAGVEIGEDGPSQMALEDLAAMRAVHGSTVLYPADATSTAQLVKAMADRDGISYIRTTRGAYPVLYENGAEFHIGGAKVVRSDPHDTVTLIGAGVTLHNCLSAAEQLDQEGMKVRVIDCYSLKPIDKQTLREAAAVSKGRFVIVEDHYPEGGLGAAVMEALSSDMDPPRIVHLAVRGLPGSGKPAELMDKAEISPRHIVAAAKQLYGL
jgi:transketolase